MQTKLLLLFCFLLGGCASRVGEIFDKEIEIVELNFKNVELKVIDDRINLVGMRPVPILSFPGQMFSYEDRIDLPNLKKRLQKLYKSNKSSLRQSLLIEVEIINARKKFSANFNSEKEEVKAELKLVVSDHRVTCNATGNATGIESSLDASDEHLDAMLKKAIDVAFLKGLNQCLKQLL